MDKVLRILMLEDMPEDTKLIERVLQKANISFTNKCVETRGEYLEAIQNFFPDIILSDHGLPQFNSSEALHICLNQNLKIPFILVTGTVSEEFAVNILKQGADDYILKENLTRLPLAIQNALKQKRTDDEKKKAEESLLKQNSELIKINKELDRFVYSASHDLRAPLKSVIGLVRLAQIDSCKEQYGSLEKYFQLIEQSVHKLDLTIKNIIDYSRNTRIESIREKTDLKQLINEIINNLQYVEGAENVEKQIQIIEHAPLITDKNRLTVILNNLISNSIKYRDSSKIKSFIKIKIEVEKTKACIQIKDNGIGIPEKYTDKIFDMFYRATEKSDGSGLGLYIVKETIERLDGTIQVTSKINEETLFTIQIPNYINI